MNVLVTGGAGFIGSNIVDRLVNLGINTIIVDNLSTGKAEYINPKARFYKVDITSPELEKVFQKENITHVIHHAAQGDVQKSIDDPLYDTRNNILGTMNLLENCRKYEVEKIIYASSAAVYGDPDYLPVDEDHPLKPMSPYGISKHTPEHYIKMYAEQFGLKFTIFRYSNVFGPRQVATGEGGVISIFVDRILGGKIPVIYGDGEQTRDFIFVEDVVSANIKALTEGNNHLVNVSSNTSHSINNVVEMIKDITSVDVKTVYKNERKGDIKHSILDNNKAKNYLNWLPQYDLEAGLEKTISYFARLKGLKEVAVTIEE